MKKLVLALFMISACMPAALAKDKDLADSKKVMPASVSSEMPAGYESAKKSLEDKKADKAVSDALKIFQQSLQLQKLNLRKLYQDSFYSFRAFDDGGTTIMVAYFYDPTNVNPYDTIRVVYDKKSGKAVSATAYSTSYFSTAPDTSGMDLLSTSYRSDGSVAVERYTFSTEGGGTGTLNVYYDGGAFSYAEQMLAQPLNLKKVKVPRLRTLDPNPLP